MHYAKTTTMRKIGIILVGIIIIGLYIYFRNNEYVQLALALFAYTGLIFNYFNSRRNVRIGKYMSVGKNYNNKFFAILSLTFGVLVILIGILSKESGKSILGVNSYVIFGVFFILVGLIRTQRSLFLLTDKTIQFEDVIFNTEWEYEKLEKVVIKENEIQFIKGIESEKFEIEEGDEVTKTIRDFLSPKLGNKLAIE
jgi:hypothetical protein